MTPFSDRFAEAWSEPTPERLAALLHPDVVLYQPHLPPIRGREAARREFERLFAWIPTLHGEVHRACEDGELVFVEWTMKLPIGGDEVRIRAVDRFLVADGLGVERAVYFDQVALLRAVLSHPGLVPGFLRYRRGARGADGR